MSSFSFLMQIIKAECSFFGSFADAIYNNWLKECSLSVPVVDLLGANF